MSNDPLINSKSTKKNLNFLINEVQYSLIAETKTIIVQRVQNWEIYFETFCKFINSIQLNVAIMNWAMVMPHSEVKSFDISSVNWSNFIWITLWRSPKTKNIIAILLLYRIHQRGQEKRLISKYFLFFNSKVTIFYS